MLKSKHIILSVLVMIGLLLGKATFAGPITANGYEDAFPAIEGNRVVWQGRVAGNWEIFLYDIDGPGSPVQVTDNGYDDISPQTDGEYAVWTGYGSPGGEIFYTGPGLGVIQLTHDTYEDIGLLVSSPLNTSPQIAGGRIVWESHPVGVSVMPGDIYLHDIPAGVTTCLSCGSDPNNEADDRSPRIDGQRAFWTRVEADGQVVSMIVELPNGPAQEENGLVWTDDRESDQDVHVLSLSDGSDKEIYLHYLDLNLREQVTNNGAADGFPAISGTHVVWISGEGLAAELFQCRIVRCPGDFDGDRDVDLTDFAYFAGDFGNAGCLQGTGCQGDFDGDGDVDGRDLLNFIPELGKKECLQCR